MTQQPNLSQRLLDIAWRGVLDKFKANDNQPYEGMAEDLAGLRQMKVQEGKLPTGYSELPYHLQLLGTDKDFFAIVPPKPRTRVIVLVQLVEDDQNKEQSQVYRCECLIPVEGQKGALEQCKREYSPLHLCPICQRRICSEHWEGKDEDNPYDFSVPMCKNCRFELDPDERKLVCKLREETEW